VKIALIETVDLLPFLISGVVFFGEETAQFIRPPSAAAETFVRKGASS